MHVFNDMGKCSWCIRGEKENHKTERVCTVMANIVPKKKGGGGPYALKKYRKFLKTNNLVILPKESL